MEPIAFRIRDFKSIEDSGVCDLSLDNITSIAGENESGKTAVLCALRDFDRPPGKPPVTENFRPHDNISQHPRVSVLFEVDWDMICEELEGDSEYLPTDVKTRLLQREKIWITRSLTTNEFLLDDEVADFWPDEETPTLPPDEDPPDQETHDQEQKPKPPVSAPGLANYLYNLWPSFVYFSSFDDILPRSVALADLLPKAKQTTNNPTTSAPKQIPQIVNDFLALANIDLAIITENQDDPKVLDNYLDHCNATISGDFLTYWQYNAQRRPKSTFQRVELRVEHIRAESGAASLHFYVTDKSKQYPEQRSRGFLWFLSFYLRLAAAYKSNQNRQRVLLIDEPGSYLHARAQRDILKLFEERIVCEDAIIYTTHSPYLIPPEKLHRLRLAIKTDNKGTELVNNLTSSKLAGEEFTDVLSPVLTAIGIDIREKLSFAEKDNVIVEGVSDFYYLTAWRALLKDDIDMPANIFPGTGAPSTVTLASLFIGWGLNFVVALDHDREGNANRSKLISEMGMPEVRVVQPENSRTIEDLFSPNDFNELLKAAKVSSRLKTGEEPSVAITRLQLSKVLLAQSFSALVQKNPPQLTETTKDAVIKFLKKIKDGLASSEQTPW